MLESAVKELITNEPELNDAKVSQALQFIYSQLVSKFQGCLAEFLAIRLCVELVAELATSARLPQDAFIVWGSDLRERLVAEEEASLTEGWHQGADGLIIAFDTAEAEPRIVVYGAIEIKSNQTSTRKLEVQIDKHLSRLSRGLKVGATVWPPERILFGEHLDDVLCWKESAIGALKPSGLVRILIKPPRRIRSPATGTRHLRKDVHLISLPYTRNALRSSAFTMTVWFVEQLGTQIFATSKNPWPDLTDDQAGVNAIKECLYHVLRRDLSELSNRVATNLYNVYGFGFGDAKGKKEMMWSAPKAKDAATGPSTSADTLSVVIECAWSAYQNGQLEASLDHANKALGLGPNTAQSARLHWLIGMNYYYLAEFESAALKLPPPNPSVQDHWWMKNKMTRARVLGRLGCLEEMEAEIREVIDASLTHQFSQLSVAVGQAMLLLMRGRREEAKMSINSTLEAVFVEQDEMRERKAKGLGVDRPMHLPTHEVANVLIDALPVVVGSDNFERALFVSFRAENLFKPYLRLLSRDPLLEPLRQDGIAGAKFREWLHSNCLKAGLVAERA